LLLRYGLVFIPIEAMHGAGVIQLIAPARDGTGVDAFGIWLREAGAMAAHPALLMGRDTEHEGIIRHVPTDDGTGTNEGVATDGGTTDDGGVGTNGGTAFEKGLLVFFAAIELAAGVDDIGEDAGGTEEAIILDDDAGVDGDIVLNFDVIADEDTRGNDDILTEVAVFPNYRAGHDV